MLVTLSRSGARQLETWGWHPASVEAGATLVAAVAAIIAGFFAWKSYTKMRDQNAQLQSQTLNMQEQTKQLQEQFQHVLDKEKRSHAESIAAWATAAETEVGETLELCIVNSGKTPVYDVRLALVLGSARRPSFVPATTRNFLPPTQGSPASWETKKSNVIEAWRHWRSHGLRTVNRDPLVEIVFRDSLGTQWMRDAKGELFLFPHGSNIPGRWRQDGNRNADCELPCCVTDGQHQSV